MSRRCASSAVAESFRSLIHPSASSTLTARACSGAAGIEAIPTISTVGASENALAASSSAIEFTNEALASGVTGDGNRATALQIEQHVGTISLADGHQSWTWARSVGGSQFARTLEGPRPAAVLRSPGSADVRIGDIPNQLDEVTIETQQSRYRCRLARPWAQLPRKRAERNAAHSAVARFSVSWRATPS